MNVLDQFSRDSKNEAVLTDRQSIGMRPVAAALVALLMLLAAAPAHAVPMTFDVTFSANSIQVFSGANPAPVDPVMGSFTVTLDPAVAVTNNTADISLNSLNITLGSTLSFSYSPIMDGPFAPGTLRVGGLSSGSDTVIFSPSTNDFWLYINDFFGTPTFEQVGYSQSSVSNNNLFGTINQTGSVNAAPAAVPEPGSLSLLGFAFAGLGFGVLRRRRKQASLRSCDQPG